MSRLQHASKTTLKKDKQHEIAMSVRPCVHFLVNAIPLTFLDEFRKKKSQRFLILLPIAYCLDFCNLFLRYGKGGFILFFVNTFFDAFG